MHLRSDKNNSLLLLLSFKHTLSLHESFEVAAPVSGLWLGLVHAIKVKIRDHIVFGIASHIDHLQEEKKHHECL